MVGRALAEWHLNYETSEAYPLAEISPELGLDPWKQFHVTKMTFAKPTPAQKATGLKADKTRINYNSNLTLDGIPLEAYDYIVNGKPALEWIMERYQITIDKASGIKNDPNDWCREHDNPPLHRRPHQARDASELGDDEDCEFIADPERIDCNQLISNRKKTVHYRGVSLMAKSTEMRVK